MVAGTGLVRNGPVRDIEDMAKEPGIGTGRALLLFDGDCSFCTTSARALQGLVGGRRLQIQPWQTFEGFEDVGLSPEQTEEAVWLMTADGSRYRGAAAINRACALRLAGWPLYAFYLIPGITWIEERVYDLVARYRHRLPGGQPACRTRTRE